MSEQKKAVFLDRDGTIIVDTGYLSSPEDVHLLPYAARGMTRLRDLGYVIVLITNQSGIARGYFTEQDFEAVQDELREKLRQKGADFDAVYFCPHLPNAPVKKYDTVCKCRKPRPGMILRAAEELNLDLGRSVMIGNSEADIRAGAQAGCKTVLISNERPSLLTRPDIFADNLLEAAYLVDGMESE